MMRSLKRLCLLLLAAACLVAGTSCFLCRRQVVAAGGFYMRYFYSSELRYHEVKVEATRLTYTYYVAPDSTRWVIQAPCYADSDLKTVTTTLSRRDVRELARVVNRSGFLNLPDTCGLVQPGGRFYPYVLTAADYCGGVEKTVVYRSAPGSGPAPEPFIRVAAKLAEVAKRVSGQDTELPHQGHSFGPSARPSTTACFGDTIRDSIPPSSCAVRLTPSPPRQSWPRPTLHLDSRLEQP